MNALKSSYIVVVGGGDFKMNNTSMDEQRTQKLANHVHLLHGPVHHPTKCQTDIWNPCDRVARYIVHQTWSKSIMDNSKGPGTRINCLIMAIFNRPDLFHGIVHCLSKFQVNIWNLCQGAVPMAVPWIGSLPPTYKLAGLTKECQWCTYKAQFGLGLKLRIELKINFNQAQNW